MATHLVAGIRLVPKFDDIQERWVSTWKKMHHGNLKIGLIDEDLLLSGDFMQLRKTAETLADLFGPGAYMAHHKETGCHQFW